VARSREFNRLGSGLALVAIVVAITAPARADEIKKWRDADGNLHYSVTGSEGGAPAPGEEESPVVQGRQVTAEETFSVEVSLRRKEIETKLLGAARDLDQTRKDLTKTEARQFNTWVPTLTGNPAAAQASLDAQRDAFLAAKQFDEEKKDELRRMRRHERATLREIVGLWKEFTALDAVVIERYGTAPDWWRKRLSCGTCPTQADAERELHGKKTPLPTGEAKAPDAEADDESWEEEDEDWQ